MSTQTNISEEVHRKFFLTWSANMASIKDKFIFMPSDNKTFNKVVGEYTNRGLPGCVGSVDCVHIAWDKCPTQYHSIYAGKEGFPSISYEVICTLRKFIQSMTVGHPGSRKQQTLCQNRLNIVVISVVVIITSFWRFKRSTQQRISSTSSL